MKWNTVHSDAVRICFGAEKKENITQDHLESANYAKEIGDDEFEAKCFFSALFNKILLPSRSHYFIPKDMHLVQHFERIDLLTQKTGDRLLTWPHTRTCEIYFASAQSLISFA